MALAVPAHARKPANTRAAEALGLTLGGPCAAFSYRTPGERRGALFALDDAGMVYRPVGSVLREVDTTACLQPGFNLGAGVLFGQRIAANVADPYLAGGYRINLGTWAISATAGLIWNRYGYRAHRVNGTVHFGGAFPFFMVSVRERF